MKFKRRQSYLFRNYWKDKSKFINEAEGYYNDVIPDARGEAVEITKKAEGYKIERIRKAEGDVAKFNQILTEYQKGKEVTKYRLYIETMELILPGMNKFIMENSADDSLLKFLPLSDQPWQEAPGKEVVQ